MQELALRAARTSGLDVEADEVRAPLFFDANSTIAEE
jgi:hypothetical protein